MTRKITDAFQEELAKGQEIASSTSSGDKDAERKDPVRQKKPVKATASSRSSLKPTQPTQPKRHKRYTFAPV